jgi:hypothetical protein
MWYAIVEKSPTAWVIAVHEHRSFVAAYKRVFRIPLWRRFRVVDIFDKIGRQLWILQENEVRSYSVELVYCVSNIIESKSLIGLVLSHRHKLQSAK